MRFSNSKGWRKISPAGLFDSKAVRAVRKIRGAVEARPVGANSADVARFVNTRAPRKAIFWTLAPIRPFGSSQRSRCRAIRRARDSSHAANSPAHDMNISALIAPDVSGVLASRGTPGTRRVRRDISSALYPAASRGFVRRPSAPRLSSCRSSFAGNAMLSLAARVVADSSRRRRLTVRADAGELYGEVVRAAAPHAQHPDV